MKRVLLLLPTTSYRNADFLAAAKKLDVDIISVANYCHRLAPLWGMSPIQSVPFWSQRLSRTWIAPLSVRTGKVAIGSKAGAHSASPVRTQKRAP